MIDTGELQAPAEAARCFRGILDAFARPGTCVTLPELAGLPAALNSASAAVVASLCDFQTAIWLSPLLDHEDVRNYLHFHTGAPIAGRPEEADFALVTAGECAGILPRLNKGSDEYPDRSATMIVQIGGFAAPVRVRFEGPGIERKTIVSAAGLGPVEWDLLANDRVLFPLGVDVVLANAEALISIPRSTRITVLEDR